MHIGKGFFEGNVEWLTRVLSSNSVDYAIGTHKETGEQSLHFAEEYDRGLTIGAHCMNEGPQIGRDVFDSAEIQETSFTFYCLNPSTLPGVIHAPAPENGFAKSVCVLACLADPLGQFKGRHVFTDPLNRRWFMISDTFVGARRTTAPTVRFRCEKNTPNYGGQGHMMLKLAHLYQGVWHLGKELGEIELLDPEVVMSASGDRMIAEDLVGLYGIEETEQASVGAVTVLYPGKGLAGTVKQFKLTLRLKTICGEKEVLDICSVLERIVKTEWPNNRVIVDENKIKFQVSEGELYAVDLVGLSGDKYYNTKIADVTTGGYTLRNPILHRNFA